MNFEKLISLAESITAREWQALPPAVQEKVADIPVFFESRPDHSDIHSGIEPDTLGLFDPGSDAAPAPRIRLWLQNLWEYSDLHEETFLHEVRTTLLHEIGHALGWDEEDLDERGLG